MKDKEQLRIERMQAELPADGMISIPFRCYACEQMRYDFSMKTGDGLPLCCACFEKCVQAICNGEISVTR